MTRTCWSAIRCYFVQNSCFFFWLCHSYSKLVTKCKTVHRHCTALSCTLLQHLNSLLLIFLYIFEFLISIPQCSQSTCIAKCGTLLPSLDCFLEITFVLEVKSFKVQFLLNLMALWDHKHPWFEKHTTLLFSSCLFILNIPPQHFSHCFCVYFQRIHFSLL